MPCSALIEPAERGGDVVDDVVDRVGAAARKARRASPPDGLRQVEVDVAVADMAEGNGAHAGHARARPRPMRCAMKVGDAAHRHRDVVLDAGADDVSAPRPCPRGCATDRAPAPALAAMVPSSIRPRFERRGEEDLERLAQARCRAWLDDISSSTYQACGRASGSCDARDMRHRDVEADARDELEGGELIAGRGARAGEERHRILDARRAPRNAVSISRGRGKSLSVAAVMMPSVPSPPMKSCFRS